ncbi:MAG: sigma-70 family RNA polymerase sigma factor [Thermodesulfovibrio sp.]|uniref:RNA polymerase sigma factor n=1 Tax=unclassified Thermodesulfovibrio TaxID=2645936 RepID=UPI00083A3AE8|nr:MULTISPECIES: sigma-70 family RNA polymerase sigma factor [unclassified Thermodesulfovibrio]MDI1472523.1 sigma-70 family RNA polymerase sigma factor [Thermodesulfovibrio sp. 1176]MDI6714440.1 sigma-70 family RNA polymerase sigma factor [Thermodesulfovibrio sp.]ODA44857.1 RNA polymerase sigma factor RpoE [Thermodesulfovibrio sp. N1]
MNNEEILIKKIAKQDEEAFRVLYENTSNKVFKYIYGLVNNKETAEDIMVETYIQVWRSAKNFKGMSKVMTWIFGIARNISMSEIKKQNYYNFDDNENLNNKFTVTPQQFQLTAQVEIDEIMQIALNKLSVKHREVLDLIFIHEMSYEDIAEILCIPINTVKTRIFYAKEKLREILNEMGVSKDAFF